MDAFTGAYVKQRTPFCPFELFKILAATSRENKIRSDIRIGRNTPGTQTLSRKLVPQVTFRRHLIPEPRLVAEWVHNSILIALLSTAVFRMHAHATNMLNVKLGRWLRVDQVNLSATRLETIFRAENAFLQWPSVDESICSSSIQHKLVFLDELIRSPSPCPDSDSDIFLPIEMIEAIGDALLSLKHYRTFFNFATCSRMMLMVAKRNKHWWEMIHRYQINAHIRQVEIMMGVPEHFPLNAGYSNWVNETPQIESIKQLYRRCKVTRKKLGWVLKYITADPGIIPHPYELSRKNYRPENVEELAHLLSIIEKNGKRRHQFMVLFMEKWLKLVLSRVELIFVDFDVDKEFQCFPKYDDSPYEWDYLSCRFKFYAAICHQLIRSVIKSQPMREKLSFGTEVTHVFENYSYDRDSKFIVLGISVPTDEVLRSLRSIAEDIQLVKKATLTVSRDSKCFYISGTVVIEHGERFKDFDWFEEGLIYQLKRNS